MVSTGLEWSDTHIILMPSGLKDIFPVSMVVVDGARED